MIPLYETTSSGGWLVEKNGGVQTVGDSPFYGSLGNVLKEHEEVIAAGKGGSSSYYVITSKGNIYSAGTIREEINFFNPESEQANVVKSTFFRSRIAVYNGNRKIIIRDISKLSKSQFDGIEFDLVSNSEVSDLRFSNTGDGIYVLFKDGSLEVFGEAKNVGDFASEKINVAAKSIAICPWDIGYWIIDEIGGVFCFGSADYFGSIPGDGFSIKSVQIIAHPWGRGYWIVDSGGNIFPFGYADAFSNVLGNISSGVACFVPDEIIPSEDRVFGSGSIVEFLDRWVQEKKNTQDEN